MDIILLPGIFWTTPYHIFHVMSMSYETLTKYQPKYWYVTWQLHWRNKLISYQVMINSYWFWKRPGAVYIQVYNQDWSKQFLLIFGTLSSKRFFATSKYIHWSKPISRYEMKCDKAKMSVVLSNVCRCNELSYTVECKPREWGAYVSFLPHTRPSAIHDLLQRLKADVKLILVKSERLHLYVPDQSKNHSFVNMTFGYHHCSCIMQAHTGNG